MSQLEEIRERLDLCDKKIVSVLEERMDIIKEIMVYKKENGLPILQPEQEKRQRKMLLTHVDENTYKDEILDIFTYNVSTKDVVSSGKTSWSATGNEKYYEVTGEK